MRYQLLLLAMRVPTALAVQACGCAPPSARLPAPSSTESTTHRASAVLRHVGVDAQHLQPRPQARQVHGWLRAAAARVEKGPARPESELACAPPRHPCVVGFGLPGQCADATALQKVAQLLTTSPSPATRPSLRYPALKHAYTHKLPARSLWPSSSSPPAPPLLPATGAASPCAAAASPCANKQRGPARTPPPAPATSHASTRDQSCGSSALRRAGRSTHTGAWG